MILKDSFSEQLWLQMMQPHVNLEIFMEFFMVRFANLVLFPARNIDFH